MKIQIDSEKKIIKVEDSNVELGELVKHLEKLLPKGHPFGHWKEYKLETNTVIYNWTNPIVIYPNLYPTYPVYPLYPTYPTINPFRYDGTGDGGTVTLTLNNSTSVADNQNFNLAKYHSSLLANAPSSTYNIEIGASQN